MRPTMKRLAVSAVITASAIGGIALAQTVCTPVDVAGSRVTHFQMVLQLRDGGWVAETCGTARQTDGGEASLKSPCVRCEPGAFDNIDEVGAVGCRRQWREANDLR